MTNQKRFRNRVLSVLGRELFSSFICKTTINLFFFSEIYMIIVPNQGIVYNEEKAKKNEQEAKQKKLTRLEENRRNKLSKFFKVILYKFHFFTEQNIQTDDTFTEKLVAQVIKNLQIRIKRVHLRYEDKFSNRGRPFATGVTLDSLNFQVFLYLIFADNCIFCPQVF